jgi:hypothetical protein
VRVRYSEGLDGVGVWFVDGKESLGERDGRDEDVDGGAHAERVSPRSA